MWVKFHRLRSTDECFVFSLTKGSTIGFSSPNFMSPSAGCCRAAAPLSGCCPPPPHSASFSRSDSDYCSSRAWGRLMGVVTVVHMCTRNDVQCTCVQYLYIHMYSTCVYMCTAPVCTSVQYRCVAVCFFFRNGTLQRAEVFFPLDSVHQNTSFELYKSKFRKNFRLFTLRGDPFNFGVVKSWL